VSSSLPLWVLLSPKATYRTRPGTGSGPRGPYPGDPERQSRACELGGTMALWIIGALVALFVIGIVVEEVIG
jgi:hypothetical protein